MHLISQDSYHLIQIFEKIKQVIIQENLNLHDKSVFLKVSFVYPAPDTQKTIAIITNPILIAGTCYALIEMGVKKVYIGEGETIGPASYGFDMIKMKQILDQLPKTTLKHIKFIYLDEIHKDWITPSNSFIPNIKLDFPKIIRDVDIFISMPKLKVNIFADITLSVKNGMGLIKTDTRLKYHNDHLHELIADIYQVRPPDFVITDAIIAGEGQGPMEVAAFPLNFILFGNNGLAVDSVSCQLMGFNPATIKHLSLLHQHHFGPIDLNQIRIQPPISFHDNQHKFVQPVKTLHSFPSNIHIYEGKGCISGCPAFIRAALDSYTGKNGWNRVSEINIIVGKDPDIPLPILKNLSKKNTIIYGDCAKKFKKYGRFLAGCAPHYFKGYLFFGFTPLGFTPSVKYIWIGTLLKHYIRHACMILFGKKHSIGF